MKTVFTENVTFGKDWKKAREKSMWIFGETHSKQGNNKCKDHEAECLKEQSS